LRSRIGGQAYIFDKSDFVSRRVGKNCFDEPEERLEENFKGH